MRYIPYDAKRAYRNLLNSSYTVAIVPGSRLVYYPLVISAFRQESQSGARILRIRKIPKVNTQLLGA